MIIDWRPPEIELRPRSTFWTPSRRCPVVGVCLHYDASSSDAGALGWLQHPDCLAGYECVATDDGAWGRLAPFDARVWHAGKSRSSDPTRLPYPPNEANSAFHSIAATTNGEVDVTSHQLLTVAWLTRRYFETYGWDPVHEAFRVTDHFAEAWPRGRKQDSRGADRKILHPDDVRELLPRFVNVPPFRMAA